MRDGRRCIVLLLNILRQDQHRNAVRCFRSSHAAVDQMTDLRRRRGFLHVVGDIGKHAVEVELLLIVGAASRRLGLTADREDRRVIELAVIKARDQMSGARAAGRQAYANLAGEPCATAMKAAISSCRTWMKSMLFARCIAPSTPLIPSPGYP
jgi:hypothetical protein